MKYLYFKIAASQRPIVFFRRLGPMQCLTSYPRQARKGAAVVGRMCAVGYLATFLYGLRRKDKRGMMDG